MLTVLIDLCFITDLIVHKNDMNNIEKYSQILPSNKLVFQILVVHYL